MKKSTRIVHYDGQSTFNIVFGYTNDYKIVYKNNTTHVKISAEILVLNSADAQLSASVAVIT